MLTTVFAHPLGSSALVRPSGARLIWNATARTRSGSMPSGGRTAPRRRTGRRAAPEPIASYLADGGFLPKGVPLLKHVMALPGQTVCRNGLDIIAMSPPSAGA